MDVNSLYAKLAAGDRGALARAITLVESTRTDEQAMVLDLLDLCPGAPECLRIGITGPPGVGKSTFIEAYGMHLIGKGHRVAVLAVDPSSVRNSGSILGDKTRMERLGAQEAAFIRPSPSGGSLGGVARRTREAMLLCEAAGYDRILVETVGVGQSELDVDRMTDLNVLLTLPGAGDELQGIKRGIMESADLVVVTKSDGDNASRAKASKLDLQQAVQLLPPRDHGRRPVVMAISAVSGDGVIALADQIATLERVLRDQGLVALRRAEQGRWWMHRAIEEGLLHAFHTHPGVAAALPGSEADVRAGRISPFRAAHRLLALFRTTS
jgi:LAO/AO transport system kinase